jgi:hypothetical protein
VTGLERGYRRLLYAYPAWYRRERGEEILDTLLAAAPRGRTEPSLRDSGALIVGGLRVRAGQNRRLTTATNLRLAVLFGVVLWLAGQISLDLSVACQSWLHWLPPDQTAAYLVACVLAMLAAAGAAWFAPRPVLAAISLTAAAAISLIAAAYAYPWQGPWWLLGEPAMLVVLGLLALGKERMPRYWLWLLGAGLAVRTLTWFAAYTHGPLFFLNPWLEDLPWVILAVVALWAAVDARPAIAVGIYSALGTAIPFATHWYHTTFAHAFFWPLAWGTTLTLAAALRLRRQAVL